MTKSILQSVSEIEKKIQSLHSDVVGIKGRTEQRARDIEDRRQRVEAEYQRTLKNLSDADRKIQSDYMEEMASQSESMNRISANLARSQKSQLSASRGKFDAIIRNDRDYIAWLDKITGEMPEKLLRQYGVKPSVVPTRKPDLEAIRDLYDKIMTDTRESFTKKLACKDGYYHQSDMQRDLILEAAKAKLYLENEIVMAERDCRAEQSGIVAMIDASRQQSLSSKSSSEVYAAQKKSSALQSNARAKENAELNKRKMLEQIATLEAQYNEENRKEILLATNKRNEFLASSLVVDFAKRVQQMCVDTGALRDDWNYSYDRKPSQRYYAGKIQVPVRTESKSLLKTLGEKIPGHFVGNLFTVPLFFDTEQILKAYFQYESATKRAVYEQIQVLILQKMRAHPTNHLCIYFSDPNDRGQNLGVLMATDEENRAIGIYTQNSKEGIRDCLKDIVQTIDERNGMIGNYSSVFEYNRNSESKLKEIMLILCDVQNCVDQETIPYLKVIWENAARCGINIILSSKAMAHRLSEFYPNMKTDWSFLFSKDLRHIDYSGPAKHIEFEGELCGYEMTKVQPVHEEFLRKYRESYLQSLKIENRFSKLQSRMLVEAETEDERKYGKAFRGVKLPIFVDTEKNTICRDFILGTENSSHMLLTGGTGSGKSRLLHSIITSIVMNYHPDDVELWLVDCKEVEFEMFMRLRPEHIRMVSLERSKEFAYAFFDYLEQVYEKRNELLKKVGAINIQEYRKKMEDPYCMPRIVIVMDEFHAITQQLVAEPAYKMKLENALSEYRAIGVSFVFSDQSISGLNGLSEKARKQILYRVAMRGSVSDMKDTLDLQNDNYSPELLTQMEKSEGRGDSWWNKNVSVRYKNVYISNESPEAEGGTRRLPSEEEQLLQRVIAKGEKATVDTRVFLIDGNKRIPFNAGKVEQQLQPKVRDIFSTDDLKFCVGVPTTLDEMFSFELKQKIGNNVLLLGQDTKMAMDVIASMIKSVTMAKTARVIVFAESSDIRYRVLSRFRGRICGERDIELYDDYGEICGVIEELHTIISSRRMLPQNTLLIWLGMTDIYDEFSISPAKSSGEKKMSDEESMVVTNVTEAAKNPELIEAAAALGMTPEELILNLAGADDEQPEKQHKKTDCYNAIKDVYELFALGGRYGLFHVIPLEYTGDVRRMKNFDLSSFGHKIAFQMSRDDSVEWGLRSAATELKEGLTALYVDNKGGQTTFKPYMVLEEKGD